MGTFFQIFRFSVRELSVYRLRISHAHLSLFSFLGFSTDKTAGITRAGGGGGEDSYKTEAAWPYLSTRRVHAQFQCCSCDIGDIRACGLSSILLSTDNPVYMKV